MESRRTWADKRTTFNADIHESSQVEICSQPGSYIYMTAQPGVSRHELEQDIDIIIRHFSPVKSEAPAEFDINHNQVCGAWVEVLPLVTKTATDKPFLISAIKTMAAALQHDGLTTEESQSRMLVMYGGSLRQMSKALEEAHGVFQWEHCIAIMCLSVTNPLTSRQPLVQVVFAVHSQLGLGEFSLEGIDTEYIDQSLTSRFDLEFHFFQEKDGLRGEVLYSTDLYNPDTITNMLSIFQKILETTLANPQTGVGLLPLFSNEDFSKFDSFGLIDIERTDYQADCTVIDAFCEQVAVCSNAVAVKDSSSTMTYSQLDEKSDSIAHWLRRRCFAPETLIGVYAGRSCQTVAAYLGILKAGLAYLPLDSKQPLGRIESIVSSVDRFGTMLLGPDMEVPHLSSKDIEYLHIDDLLQPRVNENGNLANGFSESLPSATSLAYVMFTSGSTGRPKGVMVEHRSILRLATHSNVILHRRNAVTAHISNTAFDASTWEIYVTLLNGGTLICFDNMTVLDYEALSSMFVHERIESVFMTPALFKQYLSQCPDAIRVLDTLYVGGERLDPEDVYTARGIMSGKLVQIYGPTENTGFSTYYHVPPEETYTDRVPIGRALSNSGAYVMDPLQKLVPLGVVGELIVTGDGLARGYIDPQQNLNRFVSVTIRDGEKVQAYRTGDYVRHRPADGQLEYFGRIDGQIKIRGQRVELGEIEHVIRTHSSVDDAAAVLQYGSTEDAQIAAFITLRRLETGRQALASDAPVADDDNETRQVSVWEGLFDEDTYESIDKVQTETIGRDFIGWTSMYVSD
ncbi:uncharacterized protein ALTATR162_LOCUS11675 [Alternaria atra]|uniref:AMP-dependent synthetase/ligase domain-containing protein n=1 Tax=Alternaria atra TaxID=119953 RepID=A0A8J2IHQ1_9PLEO|nr:uncharacterized protein ALTATR162_LOCUS11675 [Alternaria atra]CAG5186697.1 unnamed protein product [Alternaria atra]